MPVLFPLLATVVLVAAAFLFLDPIAGRLYGHWPAWLADPAAQVTDVGRSWWILTLATLVAVGARGFQKLSTNERGRQIAAHLIPIAVYILASVGLASLIVNTVKRVIGRPRPVLFAQDGLFSLHPFSWNFDLESFPSGHSTVNGALFMALGLLCPRLRWPLLLLGFCFALTRVLVGAHFPSDVTAGFAFGMWFSFAMALLFSRFGILFDTSSGKLMARM